MNSPPTLRPYKHRLLLLKIQPSLQSACYFSQSQSQTSVHYVHHDSSSYYAEKKLKQGRSTLALGHYYCDVRQEGATFERRCNVLCRHSVRIRWAAATYVPRAAIVTFLIVVCWMDTHTCHRFHTFLDLPLRTSRTVSSHNAYEHNNLYDASLWQILTSANK